MEVMSLFVWKNEFNLGHAEIDSQHKKLFQIADQLHAAMLAGQGREMLDKILSNLVDYTKLHFSTEEGLMQKHRYPEYLQHKAEHEKLTQQVVAFHQDFVAARKTVTIDLMRFLSNWLTHHIAGTDRKIAVFLKGKSA